MLPHDFPPWGTVYHYFRRWSKNGVFEQMNAQLRGDLRERLGRSREASAGILDSQSVKITDRGGEHGYWGKKTNGRKRHILVDTLGLLLKIKVHAANITDREGVKLLLSQLQKEHSNVKLVWTDMGYSGVDFTTWVQEEIGWKVQTIKGPRKWIRVREGEEPRPLPPEPAGFTILPRRWVVERSFAWMCKYRRLSKDYKESLHRSKSMVYLAMSHLMGQPNF